MKKLVTSYVKLKRQTIFKFVTLSKNSLSNQKPLYLISVFKALAVTLGFYKPLYLKS